MSDELSTRAVHGGRDRRQGAPSAPPIVPASFYAWAGDVPETGYVYGRDGNPTWEALEEGLGLLEEARALVFASGQAAMLALLLALGEGRPRVVLGDDCYYGTRVLADRLRGRGVEPVVIDLADLDAVAAALRGGGALLWAETPTNPLLRVVDLDALGRIAAEAGAPMVVDNTVATPALQRPLDWGATATVASLTKGVGGHSDLLLGAVATRDEAAHAARTSWRAATGGIAGPFEAWLVHRSLATLPLRLERQSATALALADALAGRPEVARVHYPGLEERTLAVARRQMPAGFGPLLSFELAGGEEAANAVVAASRVILPATSLGGVESTWERRARWQSETSAPPGLVRLSVGLEAPADLLADLELALAAA